MLVPTTCSLLSNRICCGDIHFTFNGTEGLRIPMDTVEVINTVLGSTTGDWSNSYRYLKIAGNPAGAVIGIVIASIAIKHCKDAMRVGL